MAPSKPGDEYPCRRSQINLEGDCGDCLNKQNCLKIVPEEISIEVNPDGTAAIWWWTKESQEVLSALGPPSPGFEQINGNRWCG
jgi:hypothetical protein